MVRPADYTRDAIIKAAVVLFADKGFEGTSVRDIVTKAGVNQAAINYHFKRQERPLPRGPQKCTREADRSDGI